MRRLIVVSVQFDREGRVWAIGRPRSDESGALKVGVASLNETGTVRHACSC